MADLPLDQIILGDNVATLRTFPSASIDLVVTSPPYDDLRTYGGHSWNFEGLAAELVRVLKPGGVIVWVVGDAVIDGSESCTSMRQALHFRGLGVNLHDTMIYYRPSPYPDPSRYWQAFEYMFVFSKGKPNTVNLIRDKPNASGGTRATRPKTNRKADGTFDDYTGPERTRAEIGVRENVWRIAAGGGISSSDPIAFQHPAIFPEALPRDHILSWTNEGEIVLDPFSGSGTTAEMARQLGRRFIGIEVNPEYVEISRKRMAQQLLFGAEV